jgi:replicative DNA helicase
MLEEFEAIINDDTSDDYWYDVALFLCQKMINSFSDEEWEQLSERINDYSEKVQMRCAECLSDSENKNSLSMILKLSDTQNRELFVTCVDSLRDMDTSSLLQSEKENLLQRVKEYSADASSFENAVFNALFNSIGYEE